MSDSTPPASGDQPEPMQPPAAQPPPPSGGAPSGGTPSGGAPGGAQSGGTGLQPNVAALLSYLAGWVTGLIFFLIEKENAEVRFHAAQSIVVFGAISVLYVVFSVLAVIPGLGLIFLILWPILWLLSLVLWIVLMIQGYQLNHFKVPIAGNFAEQMASKQV